MRVEKVRVDLNSWDVLFWVASWKVEGCLNGTILESRAGLEMDRPGNVHRGIKPYIGPVCQ